MKENNKIEKKELIEGVNSTIKLRIITTATFLIASFFLFFGIKVNIPKTVFFLLIFWISEQFLSRWLIKLQKDKNNINNIFLWQFVFDLLILTLIAYCTGGAEWIGAIFYVFTIIYSIFFIKKTKKRIFIIFIACFFYSSMVFLEYLEIIPFKGIFSSSGLHKNFSYVFTTAFLVSSSFIFIAVTVNVFAGILRRKIKQLNIAQEKINESRLNLEEKVKTRTSELEILTKKLEEKVQERTKDLQDKIDELERFIKLTIDRELKMMKLKEKIKKMSNKN